MTAPTEQRPSAPDREAIRDELKRTREAYNALIASIQDGQWTERAGSTGWTRRQLAYHTAWSTARVAAQIQRLRKGKGEDPPKLILDPLNLLLGKFVSRGSTPDSARQKYDTAINDVLALLDEIDDREWERGAKMFGQPETVESWFHRPAVHFAEHEPDLRPA